ncbi:hypothetical protein TIFTF001_022332 [Ficus carica]|uniref:Uncharacterized protein n=1 Tax=Ficus carica TaxID=3494 RepID=A0AA88ACC9_FICCA|nr:hypothetical protein TIFTF001_022332 [Ficus carica]
MPSFFFYIDADQPLLFINHHSPPTIPLLPSSLHVFLSAPSSSSNGGPLQHKTDAGGQGTEPLPLCELVSRFLSLETDLISWQTKPMKKDNY